MVGWPSGPRRQFKALVSSEAWVRIPLQSFVPVSLVGQDTRLSPVRPGFKSRTGNVFFVLMSVRVMCTRSGAVPNWFVAGVPGLCASRAPLAERAAVNRQVLGSIPSGGAFLFFFKLLHKKVRCRQECVLRPDKSSGGSSAVEQRTVKCGYPTR